MLMLKVAIFIGLSAQPRALVRDVLLPAKHRAAIERSGERAALPGDEHVERRAGGGALQKPRLIVEALKSVQLFGLAKLGVLHRGFQDADGLVIDLDRHRVGMAVLAAMRQREARRILEAVGRAVHDLGHHGQRLHRAGADAGRQQQLGKVDGPALGGGGERAVQAAR